MSMAHKIRIGRVNPRKNIKIELEKLRGMEYNSHKEDVVRKKLRGFIRLNTLKSLNLMMNSNCLRIYF